VKRNTRYQKRTESGQVIVFFALLIPVLFAIGAIVIDVGNWYVHKRHLQTQVDAAALASGPEFVGCFLDPANANLAIASRALGYSGDTLRPGLPTSTSTTPSTTNLQVQEPNDVRVALNATRYWEKTDGVVPGVNGYNDLDNKLDSSDADTLGDPCNERYLDVKATDDEAPPIWGLLPLSPSPKSHAKVEIRDLKSSRGLLPWAVPEIDPAAVAVLFINENPLPGQPIVHHVQPLHEEDVGLPWSTWRTDAGFENVAFNDGQENIGIIVLVSKNDADPLNGVPNTIAGYCGQAPGLVACYGNPASQTSGLSFIHGYTGGGSPSVANPEIRQVELVGGNCTPADLSAPYFVLDGGCSATVRAVIDFGFNGDPQPLTAACATVPGYTWADTGGPGTWEGPVNLPVSSGRNVVNITVSSGNVEQGSSGTCANNQPNSKTFTKVAAPFVADDSPVSSGPVEYLDLDAWRCDGSAPFPDANSVELNDVGNPCYQYWVTVGFQKPHSLTTNYTDPPLLLRMASPSGSQNQAWDCDSGRNFVEEISTGCKTVYVENYADPDGPGPQPAQWNNVLCTGWGPTNLPPPTFGPGPSPYPSDCVITETGDKTGQLREGLHERLETPCYDNKWPDNAAELAAFVGPKGSAYATDPRYVTLIITDNTAFTGSGNEPLPLKYIAGFYVVGWDYHPTQSPGCPDPDGAGPRKGDDPHPVYGVQGTYNHDRDNGDVWGYFVDVVVFGGAGTPSTEKCAFGEAPAACIAVLVE
jgi:Putative Flp pilus-assembly TadE/G-like